MTRDIQVLCLTAASVGFFHTLMGPDHYLPFIAMAKARDWSWRKTAFITFLCGIGHVGGSVVIGMVGIALGAALSRVVPLEAYRGQVAAWLLLVFGLLYMVWGLRQALAGKPHSHRHAHEEEGVHEHVHDHLGAAHVHVHERPRANITPWVLFTIFVFGPCEPLIPILMYPAATRSLWGLGLVTASFFAATISTMLAAVFLGHKGLSLVGLGRMDRYTHALAGGSIALCGAAIVFLGL
ncbi:MAG: sulfite exporter TauE/SafE family protein [Elusimicrobia bacterium]|nr:sulfite exporter TauE/SafE family protein [Elusimicrobiota bacterium]